MTFEKELRNNICTIGQLKRHLKITPQEEKLLEEVVKRHPMNVTRYYLSLIDKRDKKDPIRRMVVPSAEELDLSGFYDTSGEAENTKSQGLQHKYEQTVLLLVTNRCAAYCRFCFRKRMVGLTDQETLARLTGALNYIKKHQEVTNILLSGGDALLLPTATIKQFLDKLSRIRHIKFIRFGTRIPVVLPQRISQDKQLLSVIKNYSRHNRRVYLVTHFNHPHEITEKAMEAVKELIDHNAIVINQTVLLNGVNDDPNVLADLFGKLTSIGVRPYYLFQCRPVKRVKRRFAVPLARGCRIVNEARKKLSGPEKTFRYIMSHRTGKIEILGIKNKEIYFKYHQAKNRGDIGRIFKKRANKTAGWLDDWRIESKRPIDF